MKQINVIATIDVKSQFLKEYIEFFENVVVEGSRKEEGVLKYELNQDITNPNLLYVIEEYASIEANEFHKKTDHFLKLLEFSENKVNNLSVVLCKKLK